MYTIEFAILFPSTSFIGWRLVHNRMSTDDQLHHRVTVLLKVRIIYLFTDCQFVATIWLWLQTKFWINLDFSSPSALLLCCFQSPIENNFLAWVLHSMHTIWISRNAVRFNNAKILLHATIAKVRSSISLSASLCKAQV